jgi:hypothetical protein
MIFHRLEPMFEYPEKWDFPIYIYTVSLFLGFFDDFWRFLPDFGFYRFFVHFTPKKGRVLTDRFHLSEWDIFNFCPIWEMGSIFAFFGLFLIFDLSFLSFSFFWADPFFLSFFYRFFAFFWNPVFWTVLVECGISRAISFLRKTRKSRKKSKKWRFLGSKKKGQSWTFLYHPHFWSKIVFFGLLIAPLAGTFQKSDPLPRSCFYTVLVLVVGGVQSGDNFFRLFFQGPSCRRQICAIDFRRWYNTRGGGGGVVKNPEFRAFPRNADSRFTPIWRAATWSTRKNPILVEIRK